MAKDVFLEWKQGREYYPSHGAVRTDGKDLYSYGLRIGTRGIDGKTLALRPYGVSNTTDAHMRYATLVADRVVWGIVLPRDAWYERRGFVSDPAKVGTEVSYKITKGWARRTTAEAHAKKIAEADTKGSFKHGTLSVSLASDGYAVYYTYLIQARDLAHSDYDGFDYVPLLPLIDAEPVTA